MWQFIVGSLAIFILAYLGHFVYMMEQTKRKSDKILKTYVKDFIMVTSCYTFVYQNEIVGSYHCVNKKQTFYNGKIKKFVYEYGLDIVSTGPIKVYNMYGGEKVRYLGKIYDTSVKYYGGVAYSVMEGDYLVAPGQSGNPIYYNDVLVGVAGLKKDGKYLIQEIEIKPKEKEVRKVLYDNDPKDFRNNFDVVYKHVKTGGGKTWGAIEEAKRNGNVVICLPTNSLCKQTSKNLEDLGVIHSMRFDKYDDVVSSVVVTNHARYVKDWQDYVDKKLIVDEYHVDSGIHEIVLIQGRQAYFMSGTPLTANYVTKKENVAIHWNCDFKDYLKKNESVQGLHLIVVNSKTKIQNIISESDFELKEWVNGEELPSEHGFVITTDHVREGLNLKTIRTIFDFGKKKRYKMKNMELKLENENINYNELNQLMSRLGRPYKGVVPVGDYYVGIAEDKISNNDRSRTVESWVSLYKKSLRNSEVLKIFNLETNIIINDYSVTENGETYTNTRDYFENQQVYLPDAGYELVGKRSIVGDRIMNMPIRCEILYHEAYESFKLEGGKGYNQNKPITLTKDIYETIRFQKDWIYMDKSDGIYCQIHVVGGTAYVNGKGVKTQFSVVNDRNLELILEAECVHDKYYICDTFFRNGDVTKLTYRKRNPKSKKYRIIDNRIIYKEYQRFVEATEIKCGEGIIIIDKKASYYGSKIYKAKKIWTMDLKVKEDGLYSDSWKVLGNKYPEHLDKIIEVDRKGNFIRVRDDKDFPNSSRVIRDIYNAKDLELHGYVEYGIFLFVDSFVVYENC